MKNIKSTHINSKNLSRPVKATLAMYGHTIHEMMRSNEEIEDMDRIVTRMKDVFSLGDQSKSAIGRNFVKVLNKAAIPALGRIEKSINTNKEELERHQNRIDALEKDLARIEFYGLHNRSVTISTSKKEPEHFIEELYKEGVPEGEISFHDEREPKEGRGETPHEALGKITFNQYFEPKVKKAIARVTQKQAIESGYFAEKGMEETNASGSITENDAIGLLKEMPYIVYSTNYHGQENLTVKALTRGSGEVDDVLAKTELERHYPVIDMERYELEKGNTKRSFEAIRKPLWGNSRSIEDVNMCATFIAFSEEASREFNINRLIEAFDQREGTGPKERIPTASLSQ